MKRPKPMLHAAEGPAPDASAPPDQLEPIDHATLRAAAAERDLAVERANGKISMFARLIAILGEKYGEGSIDLESGKITRGAGK